MPDLRATQQCVRRCLWWSEIVTRDAWSASDARSCGSCLLVGGDGIVVILLRAGHRPLLRVHAARRERCTRSARPATPRRCAGRWITSAVDAREVIHLPHKKLSALSPKCSDFCRSCASRRRAPRARQFRVSAARAARCDCDYGVAAAMNGCKRLMVGFDLLL